MKERKNGTRVLRTRVPKAENLAFHAFLSTVASMKRHIRPWGATRSKGLIATWFSQLRWWKKILVFCGVVFVMLTLYSLIFLPNVRNNDELVFAESTIIYDREALDPDEDPAEHVLYVIHGDENREFVPLEEISPWVAKATIAIEDDNFYYHFGFDLGGIIKAALYEFFGIGSQRGGSTITQQLVKNTFLSNERSISRKFKEILLSIKMELAFSKREILEMYLNKIPYGHNAHGVEAASMKFFGKSSRYLTVAEAAVLASLPARPTYFSPYGANKNMLMGFYKFDETTGQQEYKKGRKDLVLQRMLDEGMITFEEFQVAFTEAKTIEFTENRTDIKAPHFVFRVRQILEDKFGKEFLNSGGLQVYTTLDPDLQEIAENAIEIKTPHYLNTYRAQNVALAAIDPDSGEVLAYVGGKDYFNSEHDGQVDVLGSMRQPGSSFKPITYTTGFEAGYSPSTILFDVETDFGGNYKPQNFDGTFSGPVAVRDALNRSLNVPAVKMAYLATPERIITNAKKAGIIIEGDAETHGTAVGIGVAEVEPLSHINAYQIFVNGGMSYKPAFILEIRNSSGKLLDKFDKEDNKNESLNPEATALVRNILTDESSRPTTGEGDEAFDWNRYLQLPDLEGEIKVDNGAKTGTSNRQVDNPEFDPDKPEDEETNPRKIIAPGDSWTIGFTPHIVAGVWVGNNRGDPMRPGATGLTVAAPVWRQFMIETNKLLQERGKDMTKPYAEVELQKMKINKLTGNLASETTPSTLVKEEVFASFATPIDLDKTKEYSSRLGGSSTKFVLDMHSQKPDMPNWEEPVQEWIRLHPQYVSSNGAIRDSNESSSLSNLFDLLMGGSQLRPNTLTTNPLSYGNNAPRVAITSPRDGGSIAPGKLDVNFAASGKYPIEKIELYFDGQLVTTDTLSPWFKTITIPNNIPHGSVHTLEAVATDTAGNRGIQSIEVTIETDHNGPEIIFLGPVPQQRIPINSRVDVLVSVYDYESSVRAVEFFLDGASLGVLQSPPYQHTLWTGENIGKHTLSVKAWDANNNMNEREVPLYFDREQMLTVRDPEITNIKNYRQALSVDIVVPVPESTEWIELRVVLKGSTLYSEIIESPLKYNQLQVLKSDTDGDATVQLWSKMPGQEAVITSSRTLKF